MKKTEAVAYVEGLGFTGVKFTKLVSYPGGHVCQLEYTAFDAKRVRETLGRAAKHKQNLFAFRLNRAQGIRVNTKIKRLWLCDGKAIVKQLMESVA